MNEISSTREIRICLMGAPFDTNNRGVSALSSSLVRLVTDSLPNARISFFEGNPKRLKKIVNFAGKELLIDVINYRLSPRAKLQEHIFVLTFLAILVRLTPNFRFQKKIIRWNSRLNDLNNCDFVFAINGGDSFSDIYGLRRFIEGRIPIIITMLLKKQFILLPQTYGPYNSRIANFIAKWILKSSSAAYSRDHDSIPLINELLGENQNNVSIGFCPDVAFTLPSSFPATFTIYPPTDKFGGEEWIGININGLLFHGGYTGTNMFGLLFDYKDFILKLIDKLLEETTTTRIALIPHTYGEKGNVNSDPEASRQVFATLKDKYKDRLHIVTGEYKESEIKAIIGRCNFFIGSRMHACIAAISQSIPTAAVSYSKKFYGVFGSVGLEAMVVDARFLNADEAIDHIFRIYQNRNMEKTTIKKKIDSVKEQVKATFIRILSNHVQGSKGN